MKKQDQKYTDIGGPVLGDCWRTAIASLIDYDRDDVPHFVHLYQEDGFGWWDATVEFIEQELPGTTLVSIAPNYPVYTPGEEVPYVLLTGRSPRGDWNHVVVVDAVTGELVWDPHPDRTGVLEPHVYVAALVGKDQL